MDGVINLFKEKGCTSFQAVSKLKRLFNVKKCGHTGTLDPLAEGVLPICTGFATRFAEYLSAAVKEYSADFILGKSYDTFDVTGSVTAESRIEPTFGEIENILNGFVGERSFVVPAYSAKKIDGRRAYSLAREGKLENAGSAVMRVYSVELLRYEYPNGSFYVRCAKGTYIRSLINDLGRQSGAEAAMSALTRTKNGVFSVENSYRFQDLERLKEAGRLEEALIPIGGVLPLKRGVISDGEKIRVSHGAAPYNYMEIPPLSPEEEFLITDEAGNILALAVYSNPVKMKKVFVK
jgi:tRNA pseudouridine55 synthase